MTYIDKLKYLYKNINGWKTNKKIIVIESDDWGSNRMPSLQAYNALLASGIEVNKCHYLSNDSIASSQDLEQLYGALRNFKDSNGKSPVITFNCIMSNPDFDKIKKSGFTEYHSLSLMDTLENYSQRERLFDFWKQGIDNKLIHPQFHGREHLHVNRWMQMLKAGSKETMLSFEQSVYGISTTISKETRRSYLAALDIDDFSDLVWQKQAIQEGLEMFKDTFGYHSKSFIPPNYTWHPELEETISENKVKYIQGANVQRIPSPEKISIKRHYMGEKAKGLDLIYLSRNCSFEPSSKPDIDWVGSCLNDINNAFGIKKPAVIVTHRVNYIGRLNEKNRNTNIFNLKELFHRVLKKWPDVEFCTSDLLEESL